MSSMNRDHAVLVITQKDLVESTEIEENDKASRSQKKNFKHVWTLELKLYITIDSEPIDEWVIEMFEEPFTTREYEHISDYLDKALDNIQFDFQSGTEAKMLDTYRRKLFKRLDLPRVVSKLNGRCLDIHIWPHRTHQNEFRSIHSIEWEHLEDSGQWKDDQQSKAVGDWMDYAGDDESSDEDGNGALFTADDHTRVRFVSVSRHFHPPQPGTPSKGEHGLSTKIKDGSKQERENQLNVFHILLVVARPHIHHVPVGTLSILNPATIRSVLLQLQDELNSTYTSQQICLEIVRPGCVEELEAHLVKHRKAYGGRRPYHLVHFDMHGGV